MTDQRFTPELIARAEMLVGRIHGISSCRIQADDAGVITEVHVVATSGKSPKLIARDVETCLQAELGMNVDYKKIGVVVVDPEPDSGAEAPRQVYPSLDEPVVELAIEEHPSRFEFQSVNVFTSADSVQAEVELVRDGVETFGSAKCDNPGVSRRRVVADATLKAVLDLLDEQVSLCLSDVAETQLGGDRVVVARVELLQGRDNKSLAGCSLNSGNVDQTVVFATLDAINRVVGKLKSKSSIEYKIR
jgi:hypothetical protein